MSFSQALAKIKDNEEIRTKSAPIAMVAPELKQNSEDKEITKTCAVLGCEESKNLNSDSFFRFPEDPSFRQIWTDLTGRNNWMPTDYSYICVQHFSVDCFECDAHNSVVLNEKAVPSLKLPKHVLEVEYIDEESLDNEYEDDYEDNDHVDHDYEMHNEIENNVGYEEHLYEEHLEDEDQFSDESSNLPSHNQHEQSKPNVQQQLKINQQKQTSNQVQHQNQLQTSQLQQKSNLLQEQKGQPKQAQPNASRNFNVKLISNGCTVQSNNQPSTSNNINKKTKLESKETKEEETRELLKLFTEVQVMQRQATTLKGKLKSGVKIYKRQGRRLARLQKEIGIKKNILVQRRKKKSRILLSLQDKIREDTNGLVLAMPTRHTDDLKNFALSIYKYSPQAYIYIRNTLRTLLPTTDVIDSWLASGYEPTNMLTSSSTLHVVSELTETELSCKVSLR